MIRGTVPRLTLAVALAAVLTLIWVAQAPAAQLSFSAPQQLPHGDPNGSPFYNGGEPSITFDPTGDGHAYVTAPQGIPAGAGPNGAGVGYWASDDHGHSWPRSGITGSANGGGDSDVAVLPNHNVLVADLEAADAAICISSDFATTFPNCQTHVASNHQGPENDREWLTTGNQPNVVFLTYHDFVGGYPIIEKSTDGGNTFAPCANIIDPAGPVGQTYTPTGGTLVSKPVVGRDGTVYIEFSTPDQNASPSGAALNHLYEAALPQGNCTVTPLKNSVVYQNPGADLARIFQSEGIDGGGELYLLAAGLKSSQDKSSNLYLFTSTDGGQHWSSPIQVNPPALPGNVFPWVSGGAGRGEAILSWFGTTSSGDPNNGKNQWRYYAATTYDGGQSFAYTTVSPQVLHYGDICTSGVFCGTGAPGSGQNRNLADFASNAVDPSTGCAALAIPGDPYNRPDTGGANNGSSSAYVSLQQSGTCLTAANAGQPAGAVAQSGPLLGVGQVGVNGRLSGCLDRIPPTSRFRGRRSIGRHGVVLRGIASDRGCGPRGRGRVVRMRVALARAVGRLCRFLRADGSYGPLGSCLFSPYLNARGTTSFVFRFTHRLAPGHYKAWSRGVDASGNVERKNRNRNYLAFTVH